jgi:hypothetical protein
MKRLVVITKDKLIATDTVIPIMLEFYQITGCKVDFYVPYKHTMKFINSNIVICDILKKIAHVHIVKSSTKWRKIEYLITLLSWFISALFGAKIIHFGTLNIWPFKILGLIFNKNIFFMQNDTYIHDNAYFNLVVRGIGNKKEIIDRDFSDSIECVGSNLIFSDPDHYMLINPQNKNKNVFIFSGSRLRNSWLNHLSSLKDEYFSRINNLDLSNGAIVYVLTTFESNPVFKNDSSGIDLFKETISILESMDLNIPILIKPHPVTQMNVVNSVLESSSIDNVFVTNLHPSLLSMVAKVWICNWYSTTCADAYCMGVPVIEYTECSDLLLKATNGRSQGYQYVDYFINRIPNNLREKIYSSCSNSINSKRCEPLDSNNLLMYLTS